MGGRISCVPSGEEKSLEWEIWWQLSMNVNQRSQKRKHPEKAHKLRRAAGALSKRRLTVYN
jgi:hypothetical protein